MVGTETFLGLRIVPGKMTSAMRQGTGRGKPYPEDFHGFCLRDSKILTITSIFKLQWLLGQTFSLPQDIVKCTGLCL